MPNTLHVAHDADEIVQVLQLHAAGLISRRTAIEMLAIVVDADEELKRLAAEDQQRWTPNG